MHSVHATPTKQVSKAQLTTKTLEAKPNSGHYRHDQAKSGDEITGTTYDQNPEAQASADALPHQSLFRIWRHSGAAETLGEHVV